MDASALLAWLKRSGYTLGIKTKVEYLAHGTGAHRTTYADKLLIQGPEEPLPEIMLAMRECRDEFLAAACVLRPPVGWLKELVERHRGGYQHVWKSRRDGNGNLLVTGISLECLAANVASFIGLHPHEGLRLEGIIREALRGLARCQLTAAEWAQVTSSRPVVRRMPPPVQNFDVGAHEREEETCSKSSNQRKKG